MGFFRQPGFNQKTEQRASVETIIMSDGTYCLNDKNLTKIVSSEPTTSVHEEEFEAHITYMDDAAVAQFFANNPEL